MRLIWRQILRKMAEVTGKPLPIILNSPDYRVEMIIKARGIFLSAGTEVRHLKIEGKKRGLILYEKGDPNQETGKRQERHSYIMTG